MTWQRVLTGDATVAVAERAALGTTARVAVWPPEHAAVACAAVDVVLSALDLQASRFRADSELSWLHRSGDGVFLISDGLAEVIGVALAAARWTGGLTDPTVGAALIGLGYDRDFADIVSAPGLPAETGPAPGWRQVALDGRLLRLPPGVRLDLGATAKGVGADRAAGAVVSAAGHRGGVLVSLGGDIATGGTPPRGGWPVTVAETPGQASWQSRQVIRIAAGAVATSSAGYRRWRRGGRDMHHIVDPRTGWPAGGPWRTASVAAATCADANAATTAAIVAGPDAELWLASTGLPARLTGCDGRVRLLGGWPAAAGERLPRLAGTQVYRGTWVPADHLVP
jgi:FAD:protein FMN transferase